MIAEVTLENFKSVKKIQNLPIKPLTIITGPNGTGKSTILEGIASFTEALRLQKTMGNNIHFKNVFTQGSLWKYPQENLIDYIVHKRDQNCYVNLEVKIPINKEITNEFSKIYLEHAYTGHLSDFLRFGLKFRLRDGYYKQSISTDNELMISVEKKKEGAKSTLHSVYEKTVFEADDADFLLNDKSFLPRTQEYQTSLAFQVASIALEEIKKQFDNTFFISGERGHLDPEVIVSDRSHDPRHYNPKWVGYRGENVIEILSRCFIRERKKADEIAKWAAEFQLADVRGGYGANGKIESNFVDSNYNSEFNTALAGLGSRQILPIIVQIFDSEPGSTIMIEEPEISLHPESQAKLNQLFAVAISQGKQIICTTHSPFLILSLSKIIKNKSTKVEDIAVYHAEKTLEGTNVKPLKINKFGFLDSGVPSFMGIEKQLLNEWSESLEDE